MSNAARRFRINKLNMKPGDRPLCEGLLCDPIGRNENGLEYYSGVVTIMFNPDDVHDKPAQIAMNDKDFFLATTPGVMVKFSNQVEWLP